MTEAEFNVLYQDLYVKRRVIQAMARKLAKDDPSLYEDLVQVGLFALWRLDTSKAKTNKNSWICQAMKFKMIDHLSQMDPRKYVSLDQHLEVGHQLEETEDGVRLTENRFRQAKAPFDEAPFLLADTEELLEDGLDASA